MDERGALEKILLCWDRLTGPNAHQLGCLCNGSNQSTEDIQANGIVTCRELGVAIEHARSIVKPHTGRRKC